MYVSKNQTNLVSRALSLLLEVEKGPGNEAGTKGSKKQAPELRIMVKDLISLREKHVKP